MIHLNPAYYGREQTAVKHQILRRYLAGFARIIGSFAKEIVYVDCCSGPWNTVTENFEDSSFGIAISELRHAREYLQEQGRSVTFRCLFFERDEAAFRRLRDYCGQIQDIEVKPVPGDFTEQIPAILEFSKRGRAFPFIFIDPTGWSPLKIMPLQPLLKISPGEVLINFMTSHIRRFLEDDQKDFAALLSKDRLEALRGLSGQARDDAAALGYAQEVKKTGQFPYACTALVAHPQRDQAHYHLIYATRHPKGVELFKQTERSAMGFMEMARADAQQRSRMEATGQGELFHSDALGNHSYLEPVRRRYLNLAYAQISELVSTRKKVSYDTAWQVASRFPLVWESDLRTWLGSSPAIKVVGMKPNQRVPKCMAGNSLVWTA